ncbi:MAG: hypothetical protein ABIG71_00850 [Candidatus Uhrbacteria bacterium]
MGKFVSTIAGISLLSGILVLIGWFHAPVRIIVLVVIGIAGIAWLRHTRPTSPPLTGIILAGIPLACAAGAIAILSSAATTESIRSPWSVVLTSAFFALYGLTTFITILIALRSQRAAALGTAAALAVGSLVALLVYPIGFGFDHFLHSAAERILFDVGSISPPPYFYSAHYGPVLLLAQLGIPLTIADRILAPFLVLVVLVPLLAATLRTLLPNRPTVIGITVLLLVPFLPFVVSTPQSTSYVFGLVTLLLVLRVLDNKRWSSWMTPCATALVALLANPLTGIPTCAIVATVFTATHRHRIIAICCAIGGALALPFAFLIAALLTPSIALDTTISLQSVSIIFNSLRDAIAITAVDFATADALSIARILLPILWVVLGYLGIRSLAQHSRAQAITIITAVAITAGAALVTLITTTVTTQLSEEHIDYPLRLLRFAVLLLIPAVSITLIAFAAHLRTPVLRLAGATAIAALACFTLFLAYPRDDAQVRSGLWSVSSDDIAVVHTIAADAGDYAFVVLGNQMLGAAAMREQPFRPAHIVCANGTHIFSTRIGDQTPPTDTSCTEHLAHALPAGGPVAQYYWQYVSQPPLPCSPPSKLEGVPGGQVETAIVSVTMDCLLPTPIYSAMKLVNADIAYVVLHDYWRNYIPLSDLTASMADAEVGTFEHVRVFRFEQPLSQPSS